MNEQTQNALKMAYKAEETGNLQDLIDAVNMLVAVVEALEQEERTQRTMHCGTADAFIAMDDEHKRRWFVQSLRESQRRKELEDMLEQPEKEPYCWLGYGMQAHDEKPFEGATPLYKHPAPTIKESLKVEPAQMSDNESLEPVAFTNEDELSELKSGMTTCYMYKQAIDDNDIALYTHPAPLQNEFAKTKSWQGLSYDEIEEIIGESIDIMYSGDYNAYRAIEQALRIKNART